jgi:two-component system cell cycle sensor histidine kinase/response regulator CckA
LVADGGRKAIEVAESSETLDLVISDVVLPGMSGPDVCAAVLERRPGLPVLFVSGYTDRSLFHRGLIGPETPYLQKPFTAIDLLERVRTLLDAKQEERVGGAGR